MAISDYNGTVSQATGGSGPARNTGRFRITRRSVINFSFHRNILVVVYVLMMPWKDSASKVLKVSTIF